MTHRRSARTPSSSGVFALGGVAIIGLVAGTWWWLSTPGSGARESSEPQDGGVAQNAAPVPDASTPSPERLEPWLKWEPGLRLTYRFRYEQSALVPAGQGEPIHGSASLAGELALEVLAGSGGTEVEWSVVRLDEATWNMDVLSEPMTEEYGRALTGRSAVALVSMDGSVEEVRVPPEAGRPFALVADRLVRLMLLPAASEKEAAQWTRQCDTGWGTVTAGWARTREGESWLMVGRWRSDDYARLAPLFGDAAGEPDGHATVDAEVRQGALQHVATRETLALMRDAKAVAHKTDALTVDLTGVARVPPRRSPQAIAGWAAARELKGESHTNALRERVRGLTWERMREDILAHGNGGQMPEHTRWLWRATGLLQLEPERARELGELFFDPTLGGTAKALILDLLANVGHAEAQAALRSVLVAPSARDRDDYYALVQHAALLRAPEPATVATLQQVFEAPRSATERRGTASVLGGLARLVDEPSTAAAAVRSMTEALALAQGDDERALLVALGNTGSPDATSAVVERLHASDPQLRATAARALRYSVDPSVPQRLAELAGDPSAAVQLAALATLQEHAPSAGALATLTNTIATGSLDDAAARAALELARSWQPEAPPAAIHELAQALASQPWKALSLRHEAHQFLQSVAPSP